jgi:hypothetical protein
MTRARRSLSSVPKKVRERWGSRIRHRWAWTLARKWAGWKLRRKEKANIKATRETLETMVHFAAKNEHGRMKGVATLFNIGLYLMIAQRDIQAVKIDALTHPDEWNRKLNARIILLTIYEWDADKVTGKALHEAMDLMLIPEDLRQETYASLRRLRKVQERAKKEFAFIRNAAIAHRDPNALVQYRAIRDLRVDEVMKVAEEFYGEIGVFIRIQTRLFIAGNAPESRLRQWAAGTKADPAPPTE